MNKNKSFLKENSRNVLNKTPSKSPIQSAQKKPVGIRLYNFSEIKSYGNISGPLLMQGKQEAVMKKLELEKDTRLKTKQRMKTGQAFVPFRYNPFSLNRKKPEEQVQEEGKDKKKDDMNFQEEDDLMKIQQRGHLVDEIQKLRYKEFQVSMLLNQSKEQRQIISKLSEMIIEKEKRQAMKNQQRKRQVQEFKQQSKNQQIHQKQQKEMSFDQIISMKQESFFKERLNNMNIFEVLYKDRDSFFDMNNLEKYYFSFHHILEKISKTKIYFDRDLSRKARLQVKKRTENVKVNLQNVEAIDFGDLRFEDLINVAAGRSTPQFVYTQINREKLGNQNQSSSEHEDDTITYRLNNVNKWQNVEHQYENSKLVLALLKMEFNAEEKRCKKVCKYRKNDIEDKLQKELDLIKSSIYDKKLHKQIKSSIIEDLNDFLDFKYRKIRNAKDQEIKIQHKKNHNNRNEAIKLAELAETCAKVKRQQAKIHQFAQGKLL